MRPLARRALAAAVPLLLSGVVTPPCGAQGPQWELQFFHDADNSELIIRDFVFPSARRGIAGGVLLEKGKAKPTLVVTSNGGRQWSFVSVDEAPLSLFFLDDATGWMVTERGIWRTEEAGLSWRRVSKLRGVSRVHFLDENHGFAAATKKTIYETFDGGKAWTALGVTEKIEANPEHTAFTWIDFTDQGSGSIVGWSRPPRRQASDFPDWMDPAASQRRRQWPTSTIVVQTPDGGKTWQPTVTSMFGRVTRVRMKGADGLTLVEFQDSFDYPSEVFHIDRRTNETQRVFREKDRAVSDIALAGGRAYLAAVQTTGKMLQSPVPGRLILLVSDDFVKWTPMKVDYRAYGRRAMLAAPDESNLWVATDTGMILKWNGGR
ncbi:MAG: hypothetical protein KIT09_19100 [Bryobacteraceae bacterium]|nr:hypothetical protein [Bryobacteraceae bacterium]